MTVRCKVSIVVGLSVVLSFVIGGWLGFSIPNRTDMAFVYGIIVEGMAGLLSVTVAVVVFRVQGLENRNQALEQSTLTYIFAISGLIYPQWMPILESHIQSGAITDRYYQNRLGKKPHSGKALRKDANDQQSRLEYNLDCHRRMIRTIEEVKALFRLSVPLLIAPIAASLVMLMLTPLSAGFISLPLPICVLLSVSGILILVWLSSESLGSANKASQTPEPPASG
jgi:hypothetical protein